MLKTSKAQRRAARQQRELDATIAQQASQLRTVCAHIAEARKLAYILLAFSCGNYGEGTAQHVANCTRIVEIDQQLDSGRYSTRRDAVKLLNEEWRLLCIECDAEHSLPSLKPLFTQKE